MIPDFQRDFEWEPWDIKELMSSIFRDYYIGSLLLWKGKDENFEALSCEAIYGFEGGDGRTDIVLDGQQRLTAMYYAFMAPNKPAPNRRNRFLYFIKVDRFMDEAYDDAFIYDWTRRGLNLLSDRTRQFKEHMFPLSVVGAGGWELPNWVQGYEKHYARDLQSMVIEVKGGANVGINVLRELKGVLDYDDALMAGLIVMQPLGPAKQRNFDRFMGQAGTLEILGIEYPKMQILTVGEILEGKRFKTPSIAGRHQL